MAKKRNRLSEVFSVRVPKKITLRFIEDPGHGWAEVPETLAKAIGMGTDFTYRNGMLYLEEDCEVAGLEAALAEHGYTHTFVDCYVDDFDAWLDGDVWPMIPQEAT